MKKTKIKILIALILMLITTSCDISPIEKAHSRIDETQVLLLQYILKKTDLPGSGWSIVGQSWESPYGGQSYAVVYLRDKNVFISPAVTIYSSDKQAQQGYKDMENEWFDVTNVRPKEPYTPLDQDDDYRFECLQMKPNDPLLDCIYLQRHNQLINFVKINLDSSSANNLTFEQIHDLLSILDKRLNEVVIDVNPKDITTP